MSSMAKLSYQNRLQVRTSADAIERLSNARARMQRKGLTFDGRKIGFEAIIGAVLLEFLSRSSEEQDGVVDRWLPILEAQVNASVDPAQTHGPSPETVELPVSRITPKKARRKPG